MERTEEDILTQAGIKVILGGVEYDIAPLVIRDSREWRKKVVALVAPVAQIAGTTSDTPDAFEQALTSLLVTMPDKVIDLFFEYAKDLNREDIESVTTDAEMSQAFKEVIAFAFPLAQNVPEVITHLYPAKKKKQRSR